MEAHHSDVDGNGPAPGYNTTGNSHGNAAKWLTRANHDIRPQMSFDHSTGDNRKILEKAEARNGVNLRTTVIFNGSDDGGDDFKIIACCPDVHPVNGGSSGSSSLSGSGGDSNSGSECDKIIL